MPDEPFKQLSQSLIKLHSNMKPTSREAVIETGLQYLRNVGSENICKVCISNSGSCCIGCRHLSDRVGCQRRNTSCTAWLCGFLNYLLYELNLLEEWNDFWNEVPGQKFRRDVTPEYFFMSKSLSVPNFRHLSEAFAADLEELARKHIAIGFILTLREKLDKNMERLELSRNNPTYHSIIKRTIKELASPFHRFHEALDEYRLCTAKRDKD
ncbi:hypothetical protein [Cohnella sp. REN36]|uniref:hypothetical protein n=1 Tax=Cohnella sp. REN36 TaxID=2887347 RepID=UPI001D14FBCA|nr:hypothetical protein [Cohnella sp. REN36]MCC3375950.1 hypothetical protein [Cohnella sp. REN36]